MHRCWRLYSDPSDLPSTLRVAPGRRCAICMKIARLMIAIAKASSAGSLGRCERDLQLRQNRRGLQLQPLSSATVRSACIAGCARGQPIDRDRGWLGRNVALPQNTPIPRRSRSEEGRQPPQSLQDRHHPASQGSAPPRPSSAKRKPPRGASPRGTANCTSLNSLEVSRSSGGLFTRAA